MSAPLLSFLVSSCFVSFLIRSPTRDLGLGLVLSLGLSPSIQVCPVHTVRKDMIDLIKGSPTVGRKEPGNRNQHSDRNVPTKTNIMVLNPCLVDILDGMKFIHSNVLVVVVVVR